MYQVLFFTVFSFVSYMHIATCAIKTVLAETVFCAFPRNTVFTNHDDVRQVTEIAISLYQVSC